MFYGKNDNKKNLKINKRYGKNWLVIIVSNELKSNGFELCMGNTETMGNTEKHEFWKTTQGLITDILERMKGHSIKPIM